MPPQSKKLVGLIQQQLLETGKVGSTMVVVQDQQEDMLEAFRNVQSILSKAITEQRPSQESLHFFSSIAGAIASGNVALVLRGSSKTDSISPETIQALHRQLFPEGYSPAGSYRATKVWIGGSDLTPGTLRYTPPPPENISGQLTQLTDEWNQQFAELSKGSLEQKTEAVARFHHRLVSIHPFLDGNGTLGQLLLSMQWRDLTGKEVLVELKGTEYYAALQRADAGDYSALTNVIRNLLLRPEKKNGSTPIS